jgi:nucleoside-diphosphate-sugar epimerase
MKILVTGASGFVGGQFVRRFTAMKQVHPDVQVIATSRRPAGALEEFRKGDVYFAADLSSECRPVEAAACIHAAGLADDRSSPRELRLANVTATRNLLNAIRECRLFIYISSASVYGLKDRPIREDDASEETAQSDYGRSKWEGEQAVREICERRRIPHLILRPRAIYGAGDRVLAPRLRRLMRPPFLFMIGEGNVSMSLTWIEHLAVVVMEAVFSESGPMTGTFNIADAATYRLREVLGALYTAMHGKAPRIATLPVKMIGWYVALNEALHVSGTLSRQSLAYLTEPCVLDCTRARDLIGYRPATTFFDHVQEIAGT